MNKLGDGFLRERDRAMNGIHPESNDLERLAMLLLVQAPRAADKVPENKELDLSLRPTMEKDKVPVPVPTKVVIHVMETRTDALLNGAPGHK